MKKKQRRKSALRSMLRIRKVVQSAQEMFFFEYQESHYAGKRFETRILWV